MWIGNVIIYHDLAYVPTMHTLTTGGWYTGEPVTVVPVTVGDLTRAIAKALRAGNPLISARSVALAADPILRSTGAASWPRLAVYAASYEIDCDDDDLRLTMSRLDAHARFVDDPDKEQHFALADPAAAVAAIAVAIVADWHTRSAKRIAPPP